MDFKPLRKIKILKRIIVLQGDCMRSISKRSNLIKRIRSYSTCPSCGSNNLVKVDEYYYEPSGWLEIYECQNCGSLIERPLS
jgi:DNA-directed RNA polymerase subunit RPC12/RpoP